VANGGDLQDVLAMILRDSRGLTTSTPKGLLIACVVLGQG
jgi:hypothetical protein